MVQFLAKSQHEQEIRLSGRIPTVAEYWSFRMGTSAVGVGVAALEYFHLFPPFAEINRAYKFKGLPTMRDYPTT